MTYTPTAKEIFATKLGWCIAHDEIKYETRVGMLADLGNELKIPKEDVLKMIKILPERILRHTFNTLHGKKHGEFDFGE